MRDFGWIVRVDFATDDQGRENIHSEKELVWGFCVLAKEHSAAARVHGV